MDTGSLAPEMDGPVALWFYPMTHPCNIWMIAVWLNFGHCNNQSRSFSGNVLKLCGKEATLPKVRQGVIATHHKHSHSVKMEFRNFFYLAKSLLLCSKSTKRIPLTLVSVKGGESRFLFSTWVNRLMMIRLWWKEVRVWNCRYWNLMTTGRCLCSTYNIFFLSPCLSTCTRAAVCSYGVCFNGGQCREGSTQLCDCPAGFNGPSCQYGE